MSEETLANPADAPSLPAEGPAHAPPEPTERPEAPKAPAYRPSYAFLAIVAVVSFVADVASKQWAKARLDTSAPWDERHIEVVKDHVAFIFARNKGGAWGLLSEENEAVRKPFFFLVSVAAIAFIFSIYRKLTPGQTALKWGLPLVLGGALGNLQDRIRYGHVIDFIDVRGELIRKFNALFSSAATDHWPTFNIADVAIVAGVLLMAVDMFTTRKPATEPAKSAS